LRRLHI